MPELFSTQPGDPGNSRLASNNPFRNRAVSPSLPQSPTSPFGNPDHSRPVSRNPFLDPAGNSFAAPKSNNDLLIDLDNMSADKQKSQSSMNDIFGSLDAESKTIPATKNAPNDSRRPMDSKRPPPPPSQSGRGRTGGGPPPRVKNIPPRRSPSPNHRSSRSQEEANRRRQPGSGSGSGPSGGADGPSRRPPPPSGSRPRRNSESSVAGGREGGSSKGDRPREGRHRETSSRDKSTTRPPRRHNDIIDQMDATSIFGTVFHHDGPFDALNPHRNRKGSRRAPMQAFPKDSLNNVLGGSGPLNARPDHKTFMGHAGEEAFQEFSNGHEKQSSSAAIVVPVFDPTSRGSVLHGDESLGLGTSTFLEGTPAALTSIQRREAEKAQDITENSLQRKKSLAQRFRSINRGPHGGRAYSSDGAPGSRAARYAAAEQSDSKPFDEFESSKGEDVLTVRRKGSGVPPPPSPPRDHPLERRSTADAAVPPPPAYDPVPSVTREEAPKSSGGGLLTRMKSLKGGRRAPPPPPPMRDS